MKWLPVLAAMLLATGAAAQTQDPLAGWRAPPIDFSQAGYRGGGVALPEPAATIVVEPGPGDDTDRILAAIHLVEQRPANRAGVRGVVQLGQGEFQVEGQIRLAIGGVILRGRGPDDGGTVIVAEGLDRRALIAVGPRVAPSPASSEERPVQGLVAVGSRRLPVASTAEFEVGQAVVVRRPSTTEWIASLGMDAFVGWRPEGRLNWAPGSRDVVWDRRIVAIEDAALVLDAPITTALDPAFGGGMVRPGSSADRIREVGVEGLKLVSRSDPARPSDEDHSWFAVAMDRVEDSWIRNVSAEGFVSSVVDLGATARRITVLDVASSRPVSELGGLRRRTFYTAGQQTLFVRCQSRDGIHDFGLGHAAAGPNVFLDCQATDARGDSGALESWASGALFDGVKVRGNALNLTHRGRDGQGVGWSAANSILWNCEATDIQVRNPPGAANAAVGCRGEISGDGALEDPRVAPGRDFYRAQPQQPASLYRAQLAARLGEASLTALEPRPTPVPARSTPVLSEADIAAYHAGLSPTPTQHPLTLRDGVFVIDGQPAFRRRVGFSFFQAQMVPALAPAFGPALTRFAPGLEGVGLTDDLDAFAATLKTGDVVVHNYGLWYDRRRVDHDFYGSPDHKDGEVWGPFMEMPWGRSGQGRAWDGLSKYDLTRFNPWFFDRIQTFAGLAEDRGVVLYHMLYLQHWLLESRAHYVDFPWRPVNALQATGLPNEVPAAETFWDVSDPVRRDLHRAYIRQTLDVLKGRDNVIIGLDPEYTGPLSFVQFWLDTIAEWEAETGSKVWVALAVPKAEMDAVLDDPVRSKMIDAVGFHHWVYRPDGRLFAVEGGLNKAPRQQVDAIATPEDLKDAADPGAVRRALWASTPAMRYRAYREYRDRRPDLALLGVDDPFPELSRAIEAAVRAGDRAGLRSDVTLLTPTATEWAGGDASGRTLIYGVDRAPLVLNRPLAAGTTVIWIAATGAPVTVRLDAPTDRLQPPVGEVGTPWAVWIDPA